MTALVTGAAHRLGRRAALTLAEMGHDVAIHYNSQPDAAEAVANDIRSMDRQAVTLHADLLDPEQVDALVPRAADALGMLSVLVNNASIFEYDTLATATAESWHRHIDSNLRAPVFLTQAFAAQAPKPERDGPFDERQNHPVVINMVDQRVLKVTPEFTTYSLAKMALWDFTQISARALAPEIRVNAIGPGPTLQGARQSAEHFASQRAATILERGADEADIADAVKYLVSASAVTGQLIVVDGGQHLAWKTPDILGPE